jgi:hypothetical protein
MKATGQLSDKQAQVTYRAKQAAEGVAQLKVWLPRAQHPEMRALAR